MGTNYYLHTDFCPCCGKPRKTIHLGKSSFGWKFLFHKTKEIYDYDSFYKSIKNGVVYDEYGEIWTTDNLIDLIVAKQGDKTTQGCERIDGFDFLAADFC